MSNDFTARTQSTEGGCSRAPSLLGEQRSPTPGLAGSRQRLTDRITEILTTHQDVDLGVEGKRSWLATFLAAAAAEEHYRPRIETVEQLDALPVGTTLADLHCDLTPPPVYVRFIDGWSLDGLKVKPGRRNLTVLWSPGAGE